MSKKRHILCKLFLSLICLTTIWGQEVNNKFYILNSETNLPIENASIFIIRNNDTLNVKTTNDKGLFLIDSIFDTFNKVCISHINYENLCIERKKIINQEIFLETSTNFLEDIIITSKNKRKFNPLPYKTNLTHEEKAATFIPAKNNKGFKIKKIKVQVIDLFGVKNLKYLPFKLYIQQINVDSFLPDKILYESEILKKTNSKKWFELDIQSLDIAMPKEGLFIVFEVLDYSSYPVRLISSNEGFIDAVPSLKTKRKNNKEYISYRLKKCFNENCIEEWELQQGYYFNLILGF